MDEIPKHPESEAPQAVEPAEETVVEAALPEEPDKTADGEPSAAEKLAVANDKYLRLAAEFDNFRKRTARERLTMLSMANEEVLSGLLPVLDDFERALDAMQGGTPHEASLKEGVRLIYEKLFAYLQGCGLQRIDAAGKALDTDFHEAVGKMPAPHKHDRGKVIETVQHGYLLGERVIRYAKVIIGE